VRLLAVGSIAALLTVGGRTVESGSAASAKKPNAVPGELVVGFNAGVSDSAQTAVLAKAGATKKRGLKQIHASVVKVPKNRVAAVTKALASDPRVRYVEPNQVVSIAAVPNDPSFSQLWGLNNTGQTGGTPDADIDAPEAWSLETGDAGAVVAVTDTGVDFSHPDLAAQQWVNPGENCDSSDPTVSCAERANGVDDDSDGYVDDFRGWDFVGDDNNPADDHNHGTHVSGTIGAVGDNGVGVAGVNWDVRIMALKFLDSAGSGNSADGAAATIYAADHGAVVSNNSWGGGPPEQVLEDAIAYAESKGMLFAAAAGNDGTNNDSTAFYPASYAFDDLVAVAATDANDNLASFSNYGAKGVDLAAPGAGILSTVRGGGYQSFSGTSMATPHVVGAAALLKAHFPTATSYGMKALLMRSVDAKASLSGRVVTGGRLNLLNAVSCTNSPKVLLSAPADGFGAGVGDALPIRVIGANCASPAGLANVSVTVNGSPVALSASSPDRGLYTGSYTVGATGALAVTASVTVEGSTATQTVNGSAVQNYTCVDVNDPWVDATPGTRLTTASSSDDGFSTLSIGFPFTFYGQTYTQTYVSSNGFMTLGSSAGADLFDNAAIPDPAAPNGLVAPYWDDLNPAAAGDVYAGISGSVGNRALHVEWLNVPHFWSSGTATFEVSLYEATGKITYRWLDTDLNDPRSFGASATAGLETTTGTIGRQLSRNQPVLMSGREVSCTLTTTPPPPTPPTIATTAVADATNSQAYSQALTATGGTPPYTWSVASGGLPAGLSVDPTTGLVSGTPSDVAGSFTFTAQVTDSASQSDTQPLTVNLADPLAVTTSSLAGGTVGQGYSQTLTAVGGQTPYVWSLPSGSLPPGLSLNASTGAVTGTPTTAGSFSFTVQASDAGNPARTDTQAMSIAVVGVLTVTTTSLPAGSVGQAYSQTVAATGGQTPYTWNVSSGSLPPGLSLDPSTGALAGTPTTAGSFAFTVQVADGTQTDTQNLSISVASAPTLLITTTTLVEGQIGVSYSATVTASGGTGSYTWARVSGTLPPGLVLTSGTPNATLAGTPTKKGNYTFTLRVTDSLGAQATRTFTLRIVRR
jgi:subtilisin family serine protease